MSDAKPALEPADEYRERAKTAALVMIPVGSKITIREAVYWPKDGEHGIARRHPTIESALASAREEIELGYGRDRDESRVHIIETTTRVIEVRLADG